MFILQTKKNGAKHNLYDISFPLEIVGEWWPTSSWPMDSRWPIAVQPDITQLKELSTDYQPDENKLKNCLRAIVDWVRLLSLSGVVVSKFKKQNLKSADDQSTSRHVTTV